VFDSRSPGCSIQHHPAGGVATTLSYRKYVANNNHFFVLTTDLTKDTNPFAEINERLRSPNQTNLAKAHDMVMLADLFYSQNACVHCLV
jgi:hypothetical protein